MTDTDRNPFQIRIVAALVGSAALSAASIKFLASACAACSVAKLNSPIPAADVVGTLYYFVLAAALLRFKLNRFTLIGIYAAVGFHLGLIGKLVELHLFCVPCLICALCVGLAALCTMNKKEQLFSSAVLAGFAAMLVSGSVYHQWLIPHTMADTRTAIGFDRLPLKADGVLPVFVFERAGCHACQEFDALYVPKLESTYGKRVALYVRPAPSSIVTPTVVVGGANPMVWNYEPSWRELSSVLDANLRIAQGSANRRVAATATSNVQ